MIIMQTVTVGKKQGLVFPVLANGCVKIDYEDNIPDREDDDDTSNDVPYGIWGHKGSFTLDALITPYDINGNIGGSITDSTKSFPYNGYWSERNLQSSANGGSQYIRGTHKMALFYSTKLKVFLVNSTGFRFVSPNWITLNYNNPASYKIEVQLTTASSTTTLESDTVIRPSIAQPLTYSADILTGGFNSKGRLTHNKIETLGGSAHGGSTTFTSGTSPASNIYNNGELLFIRDGFNFVNVGRVTGLSGTTVTLSGTPSSSLNSEIIYREAPKEATYVNDVFHIGVSFDNSTKRLNILFNGKVVKSVLHTETTDFQLDSEDLFLGANGTNTYAKAGTFPNNLGNTNNQFYGALHEVCFTKGVKTSYDAGVLEPIYKDALLFLTFEEVDM